MRRRSDIKEMNNLAPNSTIFVYSFSCLNIWNLFCIPGLKGLNVPMRTGRTDMVITEKLSLHRQNIIGGGRQIEFSINYGSHGNTMVNKYISYDMFYSDVLSFKKSGR